MKRKLNKAISILLASIMIFGAAPLAALAEIDLPDLPSLKLFDAKANAADESNLTFKLINNNTEYEVSDCNTEASGNLIIPSSYNSLSVTSIGQYAFDGCSSLVNISIPDSVKTIGYRAFRNCSGLKSVAIGNGVTTIAENAFYGCSGITSLTIGNAVVTIGNYAFYACTSLESVTIPDSVKNMGYSAFNSCTGLKTAEIGNTLTSIEGHTFYQCTNLESIAIGSSVTKIGDYAFESCTSLKSITIPDSVKTIEERAFRYCSGLKSVAIGNGVTTIAKDAFYGCSGITSLTIGSTVTSIGNNAFCYCSSLTELIIPDSVKGIGSSAFSNCSALKSAVIGKNLTSIANSTFKYCSNLESVTIGNAVTSIGEYAFDGCSKITSVTIPNTVKTIAYRAFRYCTSIEDVFYSGTNEQFNEIIIYDENDSLINAKWNFIYVPVREIKVSPEILSLDIGSSQFVTVEIIPGNATYKDFEWTSSNSDVATVTSSGLVTAVSGGVATIIATATDGEIIGSCVVTVAIHATSITVTPETESLKIGDKQQLTAVVAPENATNKDFVWSSSNNDVATVSSDGLVTAVSAGTATITATTADGNKVDTCVITVTVPVVNVTYITVTPKTASLKIGGTQQLSATIAPADATNKELIWTSSNSSIATVSSSGLVTAKSTGTATITATTADGGYIDTCVITVTSTSVSVTKVTVNPETASLKVGEIMALTAEVAPNNATNKAITWKSSKPAVATVSANGVVSAVSAGTATITATSADGSKSDTCIVTVTDIKHIGNNNASVEYAAGSFGTNESTMSLKVENITDSSEANKSDFRIKGQKLLALYKISPVDAQGNVIQPNGKVTVRIKAPSDYKNGDKVVVYHWPSGKSVEKLNGVVESGMIKVETSSFSEFGVYRQMTIWEKILDFFTSFFRNIFGK